MRRLKRVFASTRTIFVVSTADNVSPIGGCRAVDAVRLSRVVETASECGLYEYNISNISTFIAREILVAKTYVHTYYIRILVGVFVDSVRLIKSKCELETCISLSELKLSFIKTKCS